VEGYISPVSVIEFSLDPGKQWRQYIPGLSVAKLETDEVSHIEELFKNRYINVYHDLSEDGPILRFEPGYTVRNLLRSLDNMYTVGWHSPGDVLITGYSLCENIDIQSVAGYPLNTQEFKFSIRPPENYYTPLPDILRFPLNFRVQTDLDRYWYSNGNLRIDVNTGTERFEMIENMDFANFEFAAPLERTKRNLVFLAIRELHRLGFINPDYREHYQSLGRDYLGNEDFI
jgi:hypothetical protein